MLDEYRTSKMCPGGCGSEMEDVDKELNNGTKRVRHCASVIAAGASNPCVLSGNDGSRFRCDRDASATINFCSAGYESLVRGRWPTHLIRPKKNENANDGASAPMAAAHGSSPTIS